MKNLTRILCLVTALLMLMGIALTGCSKPENVDATPSESTEETPDESTDAVEPSEAGGGENLSLWTWKIGYIRGFEEVAKLANVELDITSVGEDAAYASKCLAGANAGTLPDIVHYWGASSAPISTELIDLSTVEAINNEDFKSRVYPVCWSTLTVTDTQVEAWANSEEATEVQKGYTTGQFWGIPLDVGGADTIFANVKLLGDAGIPTDVPKTWEELQTRMVNYKEATGNAGLCISTQIPALWRLWAWTALEYMYNGPEGYAEVVNPFSEVPVNSERHIKTIGVLYDLTQNDLLVPGSMALSIDEGDQTFYGEKGAYLLGGSYTAATLVAMGMPTEDFISFPIPALEGSKISEWKAAPGLLTMLTISKNTQNLDAVLRYFDTLTTVDGALAFANNGFSIPATLLGDRSSEMPDALKNIVASYVTDGTDPRAIFAKDYSEAAAFEAGAWMAVLDNEMQKFVAGEGTPESVAKAVDESKAKEIELGNVKKPN